MTVEQALSAALVVEKQMYLALSETLELTQELLNSLQRQDQVSAQLNLSLRQEPIDQLRSYRESLQRQCAALPPSDGAVLRRLLNGEAADPNSPTAMELAHQVARNQALLAQVIHADQSVSHRIGGNRSFYEK